jgi:hypothetical protein
VEERQEAASMARRSQNSERVRAHLYERKFLAKPVRCVDDAPNVARTERGIARRT